LDLLVTNARPRRNGDVAPRHPIPEAVYAELAPAAREIWRITRREPSTCNAIAAAWAVGQMEG